MIFYIPRNKIDMNTQCKCAEKYVNLKRKTQSF